MRTLCLSKSNPTHTHALTCLHAHPYVLARVRAAALCTGQEFAIALAANGTSVVWILEQVLRACAKVRGPRGCTGARWEDLEGARREVSEGAAGTREGDQEGAAPLDTREGCQADAPPADEAVWDGVGTRQPPRWETLESCSQSS
jgi:hypothetical protein